MAQPCILLVLRPGGSLPVNHRRDSSEHFESARHLYSFESTHYVVQKQSRHAKTLGWTDFFSGKLLRQKEERR